MEAKLKHLEFIQAAVSRMAHNSFLLKGWALVIVGGILAIKADDLSAGYSALALVVVLLFWILDAYFLWRERLFIALYNRVRLIPPAEIDFDMDTKGLETRAGWLRSALSLTLSVFYGGLAAVLCALLASFL